MKLVVTTVSTQQDYREAVSAVKLFFKKRCETMYRILLYVIS
jgi:hypothetical protein